MAYKDNWLAAHEKAADAERRAREAEHRAEMAEKKLKTARREVQLHPLRKMWEWRGVIVGIIIFLGVMYVGIMCIHEEGQVLKRQAVFRKCLSIYCYHKCSTSGSPVTTSWKWVKDDVMACKCHWDKGETLLHIRSSEECRAKLEKSQ